MLVVGLVMLVLVTVALVVLLRAVGDGSPANDLAAQARLLPPSEIALDPPQNRERAAPPPEDADVEPLADASSDTPELRRLTSIMSWWDRPFEGATERAPCTLIVVDDEDRPVPDAQVQVWGEEDEPVRTGSTHSGWRVVSRSPPIGPIPYATDAAGRCVVQPPLHTPEALIEKDGVGCSGWVNLNLARQAQQGRELLVPLQRPASIRGRVVHPDGTPAPGALVALSAACAPGASPRVPDALTADADGRFELQVDGAGSYAFSVVDGHPNESWRRLYVRSGGVHDIVLRQPAAWVVRGRLVRPPDAPPVSLAGCRVQLWPDPDTSSGEVGELHSGFDYRDETDGDGRFEIAVDRPLQGMVCTRIDAWGIDDPPVVHVDAGHPDVDVTLALAEPAWISGRCLDEQGQPLTGARISCSTAEILAAPVRPGAASDLVRFGGTKTITASDGAFRLGPLHPRGVYDVWAHLGAGANERILSRRTVPAGTDDVLLALGGACEQCASVTLLVVSGEAGGGPVQRFGTNTMRRLPDETWSRSSFQSVRDDHGLSTLGPYLPGTHLCLRIEAKDHGSLVLSDVEATDEGTELRVVLPPLASVEVLVTDEGAPAPWAIVTRSRRSEWRASTSSWERETSRRANDDGRLLLTGLDPGRHRFVVVHGGHRVQREVDLAPGSAETLSFDLR
ncbi:MAG TPA: hypothetical protein VFY71_14680 [Planctomycetota bacterium]|nr:hypothetical protein [Planctomycetota bacterium]